MQNLHIYTIHLYILLIFIDNMDCPFSTIVGSWPVSNTNENMVKIFTELIQIGIDYPCYPQLISMIDQFLSPLSEQVSQLYKIDNRFYLSNEFDIPKKPVALQYGEFITKFFKDHPHLLEQVKGTKACLTGPLTLATEIVLNGDIAKGIKPRIFSEPRAIMVDWVVEKLAKIMKQLGKAYNDMGIDIISMDEPILGFLVGRKVLFHSEDFIIDILNESISEIKKLSSIHVCGRISPNCRDLLLKTDVNILDHEFKTNEENFDIFQKTHLMTSDKYLALGTVKSKFLPVEGWDINDYIESVSSLEAYIRKAYKLYGKDRLIIKPDCGFLPLIDSFGEKRGYEITIRKLNNMVQALNNTKK
jgi:methionine synthase II (cobalamin-independent)